jgi:hypothetical protein
MENNIKPFFSIAIPVWGIQGKGIDYLETNLSWLAHQRFEDFEVVISDHSEDDFIKDYVELWTSVLDITYVKYDKGRGIISPNLNNAIRHCKGQYIKILFQDDFLFDEYSLEKTADYIKQKDIDWLVTGCAHTRNMIDMYDVMMPKYHNRIFEGINTISCPSVLTIKNTEDKLYFDEELKWLMDVDYYKRCYDKFGLPDIINDVTIINRDSEIRATTMIDESQKVYETNLLKSKYTHKLNLSNITLIAVTSVRVDEHVNALQYSSRDIEFGCVKIVSDTKPNNLPDYIQYEYVDKIHNIDEWNYAMIYKLGDYIDTEFAIVIHDDGFIVNPMSWRNEFLNYDYIGAPWPIPNDTFSYRDIDNNLIRVGNSVSLRSKKLIDLPNKINLPWKSFHGLYSEDGFIAVNYRHKYIEHGCKFADIDVAKYFSHETELPETQGIEPFAFHGKNNHYYKNIKL